MMETIKKLMIKYKELILYGIFGVATTLVNFGVYFVLRAFSVDYVVSTVIGWLASVIFAYVTNRIFVFESKTKGFKAISWEVCTFFGSRVASMLADMAILFVFYDTLGLSEFWVKVASNVVVIVMNYVLSKLLVFRKKKN